MAEIRTDGDSGLLNDKAKQPGDHPVAVGEGENETNSDSAKQFLGGEFESKGEPRGGGEGVSRQQSFEGGAFVPQTEVEKSSRTPGEVVKEAPKQKPPENQSEALRPEGGPVSSSKPAQESRQAAGQQGKLCSEGPLGSTPSSLVSLERGVLGASDRCPAVPACPTAPPQGDDIYVEGFLEQLDTGAGNEKLSRQKGTQEKGMEEHSFPRAPGLRGDFSQARKVKVRQVKTLSLRENSTDGLRDRSPLKGQGGEDTWSEEEEEEEIGRVKPPRNRRKDISEGKGKFWVRREKGKEKEDSVALHPSWGEEGEMEVTSLEGESETKVDSRRFGPKKGTHKSKEKKIEEAWREQLKGEVSDWELWLREPPYEEGDMLKLWGFLVSRVGYRSEIPENYIRRLSQEQCLAVLEEMLDEMANFLNGRDFESDDRARHVKGVTMGIIERLLKRRKTKGNQFSLPKRMKEDEVLLFIRDVRSHWEAVEYLCPTGMQKFLDTGDGDYENSEELTIPDFVDWLKRLEEALVFRSDLGEDRCRAGASFRSEDSVLEPEEDKRPDRGKEGLRFPQAAMMEESAGVDGKGASAEAGPPQTGEMSKSGLSELMGGGGSPVTLSELKRGSGVFSGVDGQEEAGTVRSEGLDGKGLSEGGKGEKGRVRTPPTPSTPPRKKKGKGEKGVERSLRETGEVTEGKRGMMGEGGREGKEKEVSGTAASSDSPHIEGKAKRREPEMDCGGGSRGTGLRKRLDWTGEKGPGGMESEESVGGPGLGLTMTRTASEEDFPHLTGARRKRYPPGPLVDSRMNVRQGEGTSSDGLRLPGELMGGAEGCGSGRLAQGGRISSVGTGGRREEGGNLNLSGGGMARGGVQGQAQKSYASAAGAGDRSGAGAGTVDWGDLIEDEELLDNFYANVQEEPDERHRYVIRLRYKGREEHKATRQYVEQAVLVGLLNYPISEVLAVIVPPGMREIDICFPTERAYQKFWERCKLALRHGNTALAEYDVVPLFRGETKVVTVAFRTTVVPEADVAMWLANYSKVLMEPQKKRDEMGVWTGEFKAVVALERMGPTGTVRHLPKYFFMGADRGTTRYSGQPMACFQCGAYDHIRRDCSTPLCSKCGVRGHATLHCMKPVTCNLCQEVGHPYVWCPQSAYNKKKPERWQEAMRRAEEGAKKYREERNGVWEEGRNEVGEERGPRQSETEAGEGNWRTAGARKRNKAARGMERKLPGEKELTLGNQFAVLAGSEVEEVQVEAEGEEEAGDEEVGLRDGKRKEKSKEKDRKKKERNPPIEPEIEWKEQKEWCEHLRTVTYEDLERLEIDLAEKIQFFEATKIEANQTYKRNPTESNKNRLRDWRGTVHKCTRKLEAVKREKPIALKEGRREVEEEEGEEEMEVTREVVPKDLGGEGDPGGSERGKAPSHAAVSSPDAPPVPKTKPDFGPIADTGGGEGSLFSRATPHSADEGVESQAEVLLASGLESEMESAVEDLD